MDQFTAQYHLPGLFEFYALYRLFLPLFFEHREYFYDWCGIGSIYGAPEGCLWGGGRVGCGDCDPRDALALLRGHSYQEFYTNGGTNDFRHMRPKEHYLEHLRRNLALTDNDALRRQLLQLADLGFLDQDNCRAAVDLLLRSRLTEATAFLLDYCNRRWPRETAGADTDFLDAEFAL